MTTLDMAILVIDCKDQLKVSILNLKRLAWQCNTDCIQIIKLLHIKSIDSLEFIIYSLKPNDNCIFSYY